jgi:hypothetical protein
VFTRARHRFLSWARWTQSTPSRHISLRCTSMQATLVYMGLRSCESPHIFKTRKKGNV